MDMDEAVRWAATRTDGILITIRKDGRPQSSDIAYFVESPAEGEATGPPVFDISVTDGRAKTTNMRRDNRVVLHITDRASWSYLAFDGTVELTPVATIPGDAVCDALCAYYENVAGKPHPDWQEYREAMVSEKRLLARFTPTSVVGQIH